MTEIAAGPSIAADPDLPLWAQSRLPHLGRDLEVALIDSAPAAAAAWVETPTYLQLLPGPSRAVEDLWVDVGKYNGDERGRLGAHAWTDLQGELASTGAFILDSRATRGVALSAKQRMSLAQTVGFCFSATHGFTLRM